MPLDVLMVVQRGGKPLPGVIAGMMDLGIRLHLMEDAGEPYSSGWVERVAALRTEGLREIEREIVGSDPFDPYWLSLDADTFIEAAAVRSGITFLASNPGWGGLGFWSEPGPVKMRSHVKACAALYRKAATWGMSYRVEADPYCCECGCFQKGLEAAGWTVGYHNALRARNEDRWRH